MELSTCCLSEFLIVVLVIFILGIVIVYLTTSSQPDNRTYESEKSFKNPNDGSLLLFPSLQEKGTHDLTVVIPAFDEEKRLPPMLDECLEYLEDRRKSQSTFSYEVVIVDDGSRDKTTEVGLRYTKKYGVEKVRVLTLAQNRGKGGAVRLGMMRSRGRNLLFADADGATKFSDLQKLEASLKELTSNPESELGIIVGSRAHMEEDSIATRSFFRTVLMHGFHFLVWSLCVRTVRDTQCGFKLLTREAARVCFSNLHIQRWAFDVELLYIAEYLRIPIREVAVRWTEMEGSKLTPFWSWLQMGRDLFLLWLRYRIGAWHIDVKRKTD